MALNFYAQDIFGIPLYNGGIDLSPHDIQAVKQETWERMPADNGYNTQNRRLLDQDKYKILRSQIHEHLDNYLHNVIRVKLNDDARFEMQNSWGVKHEPNDWAQEHDHSNSYVSGIVYLDVTPDSGNLVLHKERLWQNIFPRSIYVNYDNSTLANCYELQFVPRVGDIFLFPSQVGHSVKKNLSSQDRYCVAFNFFPRGRFDCGITSELTVG